MGQKLTKKVGVYGTVCAMSMVRGSGPAVGDSNAVADERVAETPTTAHSGVRKPLSTKVELVLPPSLETVSRAVRPYWSDGTLVAIISVRVISHRFHRRSVVSISPVRHAPPYEEPLRKAFLEGFLFGVRRGTGGADGGVPDVSARPNRWDGSSFGRGCPSHKPIRRDPQASSARLGGCPSGLTLRGGTRSCRRWMRRGLA